MSTKRFTEDEARRIFARVAERQVRATPHEPGLSLEEMQEAARASGLDPALVAAVAREMMAGDDGDEIPTFWGAPLTVRKTRVLPVSVDDDGWAEIVGVLRQQFSSPGAPTDLGRQREWTSSTGSHDTPLHFTLVPTEGGTTVTLEQTIAQHSKGANWLLPMTILPTMALAAIFHLTGDVGAGIWFLPILAGAVVGTILASLRWAWGSWARKTDRQFERALDRVEIAARDAADGLAEAGLAETSRDPVSRRQSELDLDGLAEAPSEEGGGGSARTRARS